MPAGKKNAKNDLPRNISKVFGNGTKYTLGIVSFKDPMLYPFSDF